MLRWKIFRYKPLAVSWFIIMCILFFLPGSAFPDSDWMGKVDFDKIIHISLFAVLLFLWRSAFDSEVKNYNWILLICAIVYGFMVEFIQLYWVTGRSFDLYDALADGIGSLGGLWLRWRLYKK